MITINDPQLDRIFHIMSNSNFPWYIAGGWSIDLAIGRKTREHEDIDLVVFREYIQDVLEYFKDWEIGVVIPGEHRLEKVTDKAQVLQPQYCLHIKNDTDFVEVLFTDKMNDQVIYRRDLTITLSLENFIKTDPLGRTYITPEWQLLFKSKSPRERDEQDFISAVPFLGNDQKSWLKKALIKTNASPQWIDLLS